MGVSVWTVWTALFLGPDSAPFATFPPGAKSVAERGNLVGGSVELSQQRGGVNRLDIEAREVTGIEGKNSADAVDIHCCRELCIVDFASQNAVPDHEALPLPIDGRGVRQDREEPLDYLYFTQGETGGKPQTVIGYGARSHVPKLRDVLQREIYQFACGEQPGDAFDG